MIAILALIAFVFAACLGIGLGKRLNVVEAVRRDRLKQSEREAYALEQEFLQNLAEEKAERAHAVLEAKRTVNYLKQTKPYLFKPGPI